MNEKPISHDEIFNQLDEFQSMDCKYSDGRILGSMCTEAHPIAKEAFSNSLIPIWEIQVSSREPNYWKIRFCR